MKKILMFFLLVGLSAPLAFSKDRPAAKISDYQKELPSFSLKDPAGKTFTQKDLLDKGGVVLVVTAPIMSHKKFQEGWDEPLRKAKKGEGTIVYLEDLEPSSFKKKALKGMKKDYKAGKEPILLIDTDSKVREKTGAKKKEKVVLVYDKNGKLVYATNEKPSSQGATKIWQALNK